MCFIPLFVPLQEEQFVCLIIMIFKSCLPHLNQRPPYLWIYYLSLADISLFHSLPNSTPSTSLYALTLVCISHLTLLSNLPTTFLLSLCPAPFHSYYTFQRLQGNRAPKHRHQSSRTPAGTPLALQRHQDSVLQAVQRTERGLRNPLHTLTPLGKSSLQQMTNPLDSSFPVLPRTAFCLQRLQCRKSRQGTAVLLQTRSLPGSTDQPQQRMAQASLYRRSRRGPVHTGCLHGWTTPRHTQNQEPLCSRWEMRRAPRRTSRQGKVGLQLPRRLPGSRLLVLQHRAGGPRLHQCRRSQAHTGCLRNWQILGNGGSKEGLTNRQSSEEIFAWTTLYGSYCQCYFLPGICGAVNT
jgi:hypothetical protein